VNNRYRIAAARFSSCVTVTVVSVMAVINIAVVTAPSTVQVHARANPMRRESKDLDREEKSRVARD
jgi:hypothetical protein